MGLNWLKFRASAPLPARLVQKLSDLRNLKLRNFIVMYL
jgi:hypothetical protein